MKTAKVLPELDWQKKFSGRGIKSDANVSISLTNQTKGGKCQKRICFIFREKMWEAFDTRYLMFAVLKNRIYFKGSEDKYEGYAITTKGHNGYIVATPHDKEELGVYEGFVGDYSLKFDEYYELYYIEKRGQVNEG